MILKPFSKANELELCNYEDELYNNYSLLVNSFKSSFAYYGCTMKVERYWYNIFTEEVSYQRIPFTKGYLCGISCQVFCDGTVFAIEDEEKCFSESWFFSAVRKSTQHLNFWKPYLYVVFSTDTSDVKEEIEKWVELLQRKHDTHSLRKTELKRQN